jgi:tRNA nucleotidyltransferase (CCA-adding enzyme)
MKKLIYGNNLTKKTFDKLHKKVLNKIRPSKATRDELDIAVSKLLEELRSVIDDLTLDYPIEPILVGSVAKDTYLANPDIDIFMMFPTSVPVDELREIGLKIGHATLPDGEEHYAEHPYIMGKYHGFDTDIVPCYKLDNIKDRMTAVDRTPFHTKFIIEHLKSEQKDEVRLLKRFFKGIGVYGAEIEIQGFSGYLCELLILKYGTFLELLDSFTSWPHDLVLELDYSANGKSSSGAKYKTKSDLPRDLANKFRNEPLVFIDPVDGARNVASALSSGRLKLFTIAASEYLENPKLEFFFPNPVKPLSKTEMDNRIKAHNNLILSVTFQTPELVPDILFGQIHKCLRAISKLLNFAGFGVIYADYFSKQKTHMLFELGVDKLSPVETHTGPPEGHPNVNDFLSKWRSSSTAVNKPYLKNNRWFVDIKREFTEPVKLLNARIYELNVGKHIAENIRSELQINQGPAVAISGFEVEVTKFLTRKYPWEY